MAKENQTVTWFTVNNFVPLIGSAVMIAASFFALKSDVALLSQKLDTQISQQKEIIADGKIDNERIDAHEIRITLLENKGKVSQATPAPSRNVAHVIPTFLTPAPVPTKDESAKPTVTVNQSNQQQAPTAPAQPPEPSPQPGPSPVAQIVEQILQPLQGLLQ